MSNFKTGQLVLITTPDDDGISMLSVEWCPICYALIPEDFLDAHGRQMHAPIVKESQETSKVSLVELLTLVSKRCEDEMECYSKGSKEYVYFVAFLDDIGDMISILKRLEASQQLRRL